VLKRLVFGAAAYPIIGQGTSAKYHSNPDELPNLEVTNKASNGFYEIGNSLSVRILDNLSFGATWRVTYMTESVTTAVPGLPPAGVILDHNHNPLYGNLDVSGWNFAGYQVGLLYKPLPYLRLGFSYRSKVVVHADGKTKTENPISGTPLELDTSTTFTYPHAFRGGVAVSLLKDKLLLAAEFKYLMYADAFKTLTTTVVNNGKPSDSVRSLYWKDSAVLLLGAEYTIGKFRPRAGFIVLNSATNPAYAVQFMAPPGNSYLGSVGLGFDVLEQLSIDIAAAYVVLESYISTATVDNSGIGLYSSHAGEFSLSGTYHM
jgi:long-subunit fatty acid transport protein